MQNGAGTCGDESEAVAQIWHSVFTDVPEGEMSRKIKGWKRYCLGERQNWRCCFCGVRLIARGMQDPIEYARENGLPWNKLGKNPIISRRMANVFRIEGSGNRESNLAVSCSYCISAKEGMPLVAWLRIVQMQLLAGTHPSHQSNETRSITFKSKPIKPWGKIRAAQSRRRKKRPMYAHSEMM